MNTLADQLRTAFNNAKEATMHQPKTILRQPKIETGTFVAEPPKVEPLAKFEAPRAEHKTTANFLDWLMVSDLTLEEFQLIGAKTMNALVKRSLFAADLAVRRKEDFTNALDDEPTTDAPTTSLDRRNADDENLRGDEANAWTRNAQGLTQQRPAWEDVRDLERMRRVLFAELRDKTIDLETVDAEFALYRNMEYVPLGIQSAKAQQQRDIERAGTVSTTRKADIEKSAANARFQRSAGNALRMAETDAKRNQALMAERALEVMGLLMSLGELDIDDEEEVAAATNAWMHLADTTRERLVQDVITSFEFSLERTEAKRDAAMGRRRQELDSFLLDQECAYEQVKAWFHEHYGREDAHVASDIRTKAARLARLKGVAELAEDTPWH